LAILTVGVPVLAIGVPVHAVAASVAVTVGTVATAVGVAITTIDTVATTVGVAITAIGTIGVAITAIGTIGVPIRISRENSLIRETSVRTVKKSKNQNFMGVYKVNSPIDTILLPNDTNSIAVAGRRTVHSRIQQTIYRKNCL
jgi:hypothetical protein